MNIFYNTFFHVNLNNSNTNRFNLQENNELLYEHNSEYEQ